MAIKANRQTVTDELDHFRSYPPQFKTQLKCCYMSDRDLTMQRLLHVTSHDLRTVAMMIRTAVWSVGASEEASQSLLASAVYSYAAYT